MAVWLGSPPPGPHTLRGSSLEDVTFRRDQHGYNREAHPQATVFSEGLEKMAAASSLEGLVTEDCVPLERVC